MIQSAQRPATATGQAATTRSRRTRGPGGWPRFDPGLLVVGALCLIALWPFLKYPSLPGATDAELHVFRLAEFGRLLQAGILYPRWAPNFYYGFGYPIFNFYAPLAYYVGFFFDILPGVTTVTAVKAVFCLSLLLSGGGMYVLARDIWGRAAGYVGAALYVYAPYIQYIDPHARGVLAESLSLALLPLGLWALRRLMRQPGAATWLAAVAVTAAVVVAHNLQALVSGGLFAAWVVWLGRRDDTPWRRRLLPVGALVVGFGLTAFFWLPIILERTAIDLSTLIGEGGHYDYRNHFLGLGELLGPSRRLDWAASEPLYRRNLGLAQWALPLAGVFTAWRRRPTRESVFAMAMAGTLLLLMTPLSAPIWANLPLLRFLQFPWRLLGPTAALLALAGAGVAARWTARRGAWVAPAVVAVVLLSATPLSQVAPWDDFGTTKAVDAIMLELQGRWLGTTSTADYVPITVEALPIPVQPQLDNYFYDRPVDRLNVLAIPDGAQVESEIVSPLHYRYRVTAADGFPLRLWIFDFPGWTATIDGEPVDTELGLPEGFIVVPVPAGEHVVEVRFGTTPARQAGWAVAVVALLAAGGVALGVRRRDAARPAWARTGQSDTVMLTVAVGAFVLLATVLEPLGWLRFESADRIARAQHTVYAEYDGVIALVGYDAPRRAIRPGDTITVNLYWRALEAPEENYQVFVHLLQPDGAVAAQSDKLNPGDFPTRRWDTEHYVRDTHRFTIPPELPSGEYTLTAGLWLQFAGERLPVTDGAGGYVGDYLPLQPVVVR